MKFNEELNKAQPVKVSRGDSSYFSKPQLGLDPRLFRNNKLIPGVRDGILGALFGYLHKNYSGAESWTHAWLAGSGVSHQWAAERQPADLDCLLGINYEQFRMSNEKYRGLADREISSMLNEQLRTELWPSTNEFLGSFELTFYVNVQPDITKIKPYAAYSLTDDNWIVEPSTQTAEHKPEWDVKVNRDQQLGREIINRYTQALNKFQAAQNDAARVNAKTELLLAISQGSALFEDIHQGRKAAFSEYGQGYSDFNNYRWQANKDSGIVPALKKLKELSEDIRKVSDIRLYGQELPSTDTLIRRAISQQ